MTPYEKARLVYLQEPCARSFGDDLRLHHLNGYVFSTPEYFIMGRAVCKGAPRVLVTDPSVKFDNPDCWLVYLAAGDRPFERFFSLMPYSLPWIAWERQNKLRYYEAAKLRNKICKIESKQLEIHAEDLLT